MQKTRILVVEDEVDILDNVVETLEIEGFDVRGTSDGRESIAIAQQFRPDLILCDIMMPNFNGYDVLMSVRSDTTIATTPFIFLTALAARSAMRHGMELGADDYLTKPFTPAELMAAINTRLEKHRQIKEINEERLQQLRHNITHALPHELRTPLTGIIGCADFLMMDYKNIAPENLLNISEVMMRSATRLQRVIENYLLYAQIELVANDPERLEALKLDTLDYPQVIIDQIAQESAHTTERTADLQVNTQPATIRISDENFTKIMTELIDNAFKFSKTGTDIQIDAQPQDGQYVITVQDAGRGMSAEDIQNIGAYMQFNRILHEQQGLGLGLTIARQLTELHDGTFEIESAINGGTTVTIALPTT